MDPFAPTLVRQRSAPVLSEAEQEQLALLGRRLKSELLALVNWLPAGIRQTRPLGRYLSIDRNITQRILGVTSNADEGIEVLARLPGVNGLRQFIGAVAKLRAPASDVGAATAAVDQFERMIQEFAGSHARLIARIQASQQHPAARGLIEADPTLDTRELLHQGAVAHMGRQIDVNIALGVYFPSKSSPGMIECGSASALIGHQARPDAVPLTLSYRRIDRGDDTNMISSVESAPSPHTDVSEWLIEQFSTRPLPIMSSRKMARDTHTQIIDPNIASKDPKLDIVIGRYRGPSSFGVNVPVLGMGVSIRHPAKRLIMDTYLHRSQALACVPSLRAYSRPPDPTVPLDRLWPDQVPGVPRLQFLGPGLEHAPSDAWAKHAELTRYTFDRLRLPAEEFIGFRCDFAYPIWGVSYFMAFDFSPPTAEGQEADGSSRVEDDEQI